MARKQRRNFRSWIRDHGATILAFILGGVLLLSSSWTADYVRDGYDESSFKLWPFIVSFTLMTGSMLGLYKLRSTILPIASYLEGESPTPHKAAILLVSLKGKLDRSHGSELVFVGGKTVPLSGDLEKDIAALHGSQLGFTWSWQQLLRAIQPHKDSLTHLYLVGSKEEPGSPGSHEDLELCRSLFQFYLGDKVDMFLAPAVDFEDISAVRRAVGSCIKQLTAARINEDDILVDITGGQKVTTVAAAIATLNHQGVQFQYVSNSGDPMVYDLVTVSPINFSE